jgi:hypothetical protein
VTFGLKMPCRPTHGALCHSLLRWTVPKRLRRTILLSDLRHSLFGSFDNSCLRKQCGGGYLIPNGLIATDLLSSSVRSLVRVGYVKPLRLLVRSRVGYVRPLRMGAHGSQG